MAITAAEVNKLRQQTGAGMMDCKKALAETNGNFEEAIVYLRKKGQKVSALRSDKEAKEGVIIAQTTADNKRGVIVYLSCETDFVAKNTDFVLVTASIADAALKNNAADAEQVLNLQLNGVAIKDIISEQVAKIGEKIELKRFEKMEGEYVQSYIHAGNKIGVLVSLNKSKSESPFVDWRNSCRLLYSSLPDKSKTAEENHQQILELSKLLVVNMNLHLFVKELQKRNSSCQK